MRYRKHLLGHLGSRLLRRGECRRIALVGSQASGKTVFLTSLLDHLSYHDPALLPLGPGVEIVNCRLARSGRRFPLFPFPEYRATLLHEAGWPAKTTAVTEIRVELELRGGPYGRGREMRCEFLDFPGERAADLLMYGRDYAAWSDLLLGHLVGDPIYAGLARDFIAMTAGPATAGKAALVWAYKLFLGTALQRCYSRIVTPSLFLLDEAGSRPAPGPGVETWAQERFCGLGPEAEFVPLPAVAREQRPELARLFAERFRAYRRRVVDPLADWLAVADQLYLLLDVPGILMAGAALYNDELAVCEQVLDLCKKRDFLSELWRIGILGWLLLRPARIERVGIVATKADLVAGGDDLDNLESLIRQMLYPHLRGLRIKAGEFFSCAAVVSAERVGKRPILRGRTIFDETGRLRSRQAPPVEFAPSRVPEFWPADGQWHGFSFPEVYPRIPARRNQPPAQYGLDRIVRFMLR